MSETQGQKVVRGGGIVIIYFGELPILGEIMPIGGQIPFFCLKEHPCIGEKKSLLAYNVKSAQEVKTTTRIVK